VGLDTSRTVRCAGNIAVGGHGRVAGAKVLSANADGAGGHHAVRPGGHGEIPAGGGIRASIPRIDASRSVGRAGDTAIGGDERIPAAKVPGANTVVVAADIAVRSCCNGEIVASMLRKDGRLACGRDRAVGGDGCVSGAAVPGVNATLGAGQYAASFDRNAALVAVDNIALRSDREGD